MPHTHLKVSTPSKQDRHLYLNRKGFYSLNAMLICDDRMYITFVDSNSPGSFHDSFIWNSSEVDTYLEGNSGNGQTNTWLLGDAGYPLKPYLMTPFRSSSEGSRERIFNNKHSKSRMIIERTIGLLKNRYRCLMDKLHYHPNKAAQIANICCALHNMCILHHVELEINMLPVIDPPIELAEEGHTDAAQRIRMQLMNSIVN